MNIRKEKEKDFFVQHMDTFRKIGTADPFFIIKTAFFQKGKFGRQVQFFESEIGKGEDIYVEFYDNVTDSKGSITDVTPFSADRQLFKYKYNPYYKEEYDIKEGTSSKGDAFRLYTVPLSEFTAVLPDGNEITYALYEKRKTEAETKVKDEEPLPRLQKTLSIFPDFESEFPAKPKTTAFENEASQQKEVLISEMTIEDFAAIIWKRPVSNKEWLNNLINAQ